MRISVFGLGYVGAVSLGCLARDGHRVIGVDVDRTKTELIREGKSPIIENGMQELIAQAMVSGRLEVTEDATYAVHNTEMSLVCVGTPPNPNGSQNLGAIERLSGQLGAAIRSKSAYHLFVIRSTVFPGTVDEKVKPMIETGSGKRSGGDFDVCFQPEFLREGSSIKDYDNPPYTVIGTDSERATELVRKVFAHLPGEFITTTVRAAEMLKYACNCFHALKITFANEIGRLSQMLGVDPHAVMDTVCRDTSLNLSSAYMKPGFAFGGSCLPKDLEAMLYVARKNDAAVPMLAGIVASNRVHIEHAMNLVLARGRKRIGMFGLSFKSGTDDLRESPLVVMAERFIGKGLDLRIYDPEVNLSRLVGANRRFIEDSIPHISSLMSEDYEELVAWADVVIVGLTNPDVVHTIVVRARDDQFILDLVNLPDKDKLKSSYQGICW